MLNTCFFIGRITAYPAIWKTQSGISVCPFSIACERDFSGNEKITDFIDIVAFRELGERINKYCDKGSLILVRGCLQFKQWNDKNGNKRKTAEIIADRVWFLDSKKKNSDNGEGEVIKPDNFSLDINSVSDDELPF